MNLLAFDTSTEVLSVAVSRGAAHWAQQGPGGAQASSSLIPICMDLLAHADLGLRQLDAIVFGRGPGSFTGLRTACAVAQGLGAGSERPVLPVDTLLALAEDARARLVQTSGDAPLGVLAVLDARMGEVYSAGYRWDGQQWHELLGPSLHAPDAGTNLPFAGRWCLAGSGAALAESAVRVAWPAGAEWLGVDAQAVPTAQALLRLAPGMLAAGAGVAAHLAMPLYLRDKVAQTTAERTASALARAAAAAPATPMPSAHWRDMRPADLERVCAIEQTAYSHPWTPGHFADSLQAGYRLRLLEVAGVLVGYSVLMKGVNEAHLLNITVRPDRQGQGWGKHLLAELGDWSRARGLDSVWLEVRAGNEVAQGLYIAKGFRRAGLRKGYYPAASATREDAVVMCLALTAAGHGAEPLEAPARPGASGVSA